MAKRLPFYQFRPPPVRGSRIYHLEYLPAYHFPFSPPILPASLSTTMYQFNAPVGFPILLYRTCLFIVLLFHRAFRFALPPFPNLSPYPFWKSTILIPPMPYLLVLHFAIFAYLARLPVPHFTIFPKLARLPGFPNYHFTHIPPFRFGSLSLYHFIPNARIHISIFADLSFFQPNRFTIYRFSALGIYRFTILARRRFPTLVVTLAI